MLAPDERQVLLDLLRPPPGFELDRAVGTTFSIDLEAALIAPLAFASFRLSGTSDPIAVMEAVRSAADRIDVFNQAGQMHAPAEASGLFAFLEPVVHDARAPSPGFLFHPKVWLLRYTSPDDEPWVRLLCLTRNLTKDASWDVALRLDGWYERRDAANRPLRDFIRALPGLAVHPLPRERVDAIHELAESVMRATWELPDGFTTGPTFWPLGIEKKPALPDFSGYRHLVVAPFMNDGGLDVVASDPRSHVTVVSRVEDLDRLSAATIERLGAVHVVSSAADLDDPDDDAAVLERDRLHGLHAKLYAVERNRAASLFFGSANATNAAFGGNVEFLVELRGGATKVGVDQLLADDTGFRPILEDYAPRGDEPPDPLDEALHQLRNALRSIAETPLTAAVVPAGDAWTVHVSTAAPVDVPDGMAASMELLTARGNAAPMISDTPVDATFGPVALDEVTPFVLVRVRGPAPDGDELVRATVVRAQLVDDPDGRLDEILARQVDTPEKFLRFLLLLLGLSDGALIAGEGVGGEAQVWGTIGSTNGVFELLMRAATDRPEVVDDLQRIVGRLRTTERGRQALPDGFDELWDVIEKAGAGLQAVCEVSEAVS